MYKIWYPGVIFGADFKHFVKFEKFLLDTPFLGPFWSVSLIFSRFVWNLVPRGIFWRWFQKFCQIWKIFTGHALCGPFLVRFFNIKPICIKVLKIGCLDWLKLNFPECNHWDECVFFCDVYRSTNFEYWFSDQCQYRYWIDQMESRKARNAVYQVDYTR